MIPYLCKSGNTYHGARGRKIFFANRNSTPENIQYAAQRRYSDEDVTRREIYLRSKDSSACGNSASYARNKRRYGISLLMHSDPHQLSD